MRKNCLTVVLVVLALSATGCAVSVGGGKLYIFDVLEYVKVSNNTKYVLDVERNQELFRTLGPGQSCSIPFHTGPNMVITVKATETTASGASQYIGMEERTFYPMERMNEYQSWMVSYIQHPIVR